MEEINASIAQWEKFEESLIWKDILETIHDQINMKKDELLVCNDLRTLHITQGAVLELIKFTEFPSNIINDLEAGRQIEEAKKEEESND